MSSGSGIYRRRTDAARDVLGRSGLDAIVIGQPANREYLSGFSWHDETSSASVGWIVLTESSGFLLTNFNHAAAAESSGHLEVSCGPGRLIDALVDLLGKLPGRRIGFESEWISVSTFECLQKAIAPARELVAVDGLIEKLRETKDSEETARVRKSAAITDEAYCDVAKQLRPGQSEREIAWMFERSLRDHGADGMAFGPSVAAGTHAAVPHHESTDYVIQPGDPVWVDLGARCDGYCADLTRSFCLGRVSTEYVDRWNLVLSAETAALDALRECLTGKQIDAVARDLIASAGLAAEFGHGLGHGLGMMIHEAPRLSWLSDDVMRSGMVVTIEPGVYFSGWGGIRIEDVALVQPDGCLILSSAPKTPLLGQM
ncbi:MAG TPA: Xaa-Pro peptidase family protein [Chloroflexota bacterium]|nr:Xaa-Pro peptidase family protein [Chloroflexota bacterium]